MATVQAKEFPNSTCLVTTVPLYSPAMWTAAEGTSPEANAGAAFVTSDVSYQTLPSWSYWTMFADRS